MAHRTLSLAFDPIRSPPLALKGARRHMSPGGDNGEEEAKVEAAAAAGTALKKGPSPTVTIGAPDAGLRGVDSGAGDMSGGRQGERLDAHSTRTHHRRTVGYTNRKICERRGY